MLGDESGSFAKSPDHIKRFEEADPLNFAALDTTSNGQFQAAFFSPGGLRAAGPHIRPFAAVDGTHTKSRYQMMLLIACGIDANDQSIALAWALVPIEDASWWNWFLRYLKACYPLMDLENHTFISDREKEFLRLFMSNLSIQFTSIAVRILLIIYSNDLERRLGLFSGKLEEQRLETCSSQKWRKFTLKVRLHLRT
jgi:hypothetical protein